MKILRAIPARRRILKLNGKLCSRRPDEAPSTMHPRNQPGVNRSFPKLILAGLLWANLFVGAVWLNSGYHGLEWHLEIRPQIEGRALEAMHDDPTIPWRAFYRQGGDEVMYFEYSNRLLGQPVDDALLRAKHGHTPGFEHYFAPSTTNRAIPYRDAWTEYPPLALPWFLLPRLITNHLADYGFWFAVEMSLLLVGSLAMVAAMLAAETSDPHERYQRLVAALLYGIGFQLAMGTMLITRYDAAVSFLIIGALLLHRRGSIVGGGLMLAAAASAKLFPLLFVPLFYAAPLLRGEFRLAARGVASVVCGCLALNLPFAIWGGEGFIDVFRYHAERGLEANSTWAALLVGLNKLGLAPLAGEFRFGCMEVEGPWVSALIGLSTLASLAMPVVVGAQYIRRLRQGYTEAEILPLFCLAMTAGFIISGKVFSPQYVVWCFPLVLLVSGKVGSRLRRVLLVVALLVQFDHPWLAGLIGVELPPTWFGWSLIVGRLLGMGYMFWTALTCQPARSNPFGSLLAPALPEKSTVELVGAAGGC